MIRVKLMDEEKRELEILRKTRSSKSERALYVLLSDKGWDVKEIAVKLNRNEHTVGSWLKRYVAEGINGLTNKLAPGRPKIKGILVEDELEHILVQSPREYGYQEEGWTVRLIIDYFSKKQIEVKEDTVRRALQKKGWVYKRFAKSVSKNAPTKEEKQKRVAALIDQINADDPDEVFFVDESNFTMGPYVQRGWFRKREKKKFAVH